MTISNAIQQHLKHSQLFQVMHIQSYDNIININLCNSGSLKQRQQGIQLSLSSLRSSHNNLCDKGYKHLTNGFWNSTARQARSLARYGELRKKVARYGELKASKTGCSRPFDISHSNPIFNFHSFNLSLRTCLIVIIHIQTLKTI